MSYYGVNEMREEEKKVFLVWYESQRSESFDNKRVFETYYKDDVTVLRQACLVFRRQFLPIGHIDVSVEAIRIASASNKFLRKLF